MWRAPAEDACESYLPDVVDRELLRRVRPVGSPALEEAPSYTGLWDFFKRKSIPSFADREGHFRVLVSAVITQLLSAAAPLCQFLPSRTQI